MAILNSRVWWELIDLTQTPFTLPPPRPSPIKKKEICNQWKVMITFWQFWNRLAHIHQLFPTREFTWVFFFSPQLSSRPFAFLAKWNPWSLSFTCTSMQKKKKKREEEEEEERGKERYHGMTSSCFDSHFSSRISSLTRNQPACCVWKWHRASRTSLPIDPTC